MTTILTLLLAFSLVTEAIFLLMGRFLPRRAALLLGGSIIVLFFGCGIGWWLSGEDSHAAIALMLGVFTTWWLREGLIAQKNAQAEAEFYRERPGLKLIHRAGDGKFRRLVRRYYEAAGWQVEKQRNRYAIVVRQGEVTQLIYSRFCRTGVLRSSAVDKVAALAKSLGVEEAVLIASGPPSNGAIELAKVRGVHLVGPEEFAEILEAIGIR